MLKLVTLPLLLPLACRFIVVIKSRDKNDVCVIDQAFAHALPRVGRRDGA